MRLPALLAVAAAAVAAVALGAQFASSGAPAAAENPPAGGAHRPPPDATAAGAARPDPPGDEPTADSLFAFLTRRYAVTFPAAAAVKQFAAQKSRDMASGKRPTTETFAEVRLTADGYDGLRKGLLSDGPRPKGQTLLWEGKERPAMLGGVPAPLGLPKGVDWWRPARADTVCYFSNAALNDEGLLKESAGLVMYLSEKDRSVHLWAYVLGPEPTPFAAPEGYEVVAALLHRGKDLGPELEAALGTEAAKGVVRFGPPGKTLLSRFEWAPAGVKPGESVRVYFPSVASPKHVAVKVGGTTAWSAGPHDRSGVLSDPIEVPRPAAGTAPARLVVRVWAADAGSFVPEGVDNVFVLRPKAQR